MNRKDMKLDHKKKGSTADLRRKEKENRKLQQELNLEKEKFNHMAIKYQKELSEMQAVRDAGVLSSHLFKFPFSLMPVLYLVSVNSNCQRSSLIAMSFKCS